MTITIILLLILWSWGLTPLWVNIAATVLIGIKISLKLLKLILEFINATKEEI